MITIDKNSFFSECSEIIQSQLSSLQSTVLSMVQNSETHKIIRETAEITIKSTVFEGSKEKILKRFPDYTNNKQKTESIINCDPDKSKKLKILILYFASMTTHTPTNEDIENIYSEIRIHCFKEINSIISVNDLTKKTEKDIEEEILNILNKK